jgi:LPS-assembly protein
LPGGRIELQANSLNILRTEGQDTQRAFASARWDRRMLTPFGQELTLTALARRHLPFERQRADADCLLSRRRRLQTRFIGALAADLAWPFIGTFMNGTQRLTPREPAGGLPGDREFGHPNEYSRAVDLEDTNLFALNRFPGHDRWEDGVRLTYGADWAVDLPGVAIRTTVGQSYHLDNRENLFPRGTGLADRFSDFVGRTNVQVGSGVSFTHRFRIDKDDFTLRRNEIDAVVGSRDTYASVGYLRLNRDISAAIEDLSDREEVRVGGRVAFARYWSIFGSAVIDLTDRAEDPLSRAEGSIPCATASASCMTTIASNWRDVATRL